MIDQEAKDGGRGGRGMAWTRCVARTTGLPHDLGNCDL
jgi:hypothetical protein